MGVEQFRYDGKRVLVAGGATGMGAAVSKLVTELGGEVHVADVQPVDYPVAGAVSMDLRDESSINAALAEIGAPIHSIFRARERFSGAPFSPVDVMLINFVGARHLVESAVESMMPEGSSIAFISSIGGLGWEKVLNRVLEFLRHSRLRARNVGARARAGTPEQAEEMASAKAACSGSGPSTCTCSGRRCRSVAVASVSSPTGPGPTMTPLMDSTPTWQIFGDMLFKAAIQPTADSQRSRRRRWCS